MLYMTIFSYELERERTEWRHCAGAHPSVPGRSKVESH